jgi:hypothetical protein
MIRIIFFLGMDSWLMKIKFDGHMSGLARRQGLKILPSTTSATPALTTEEKKAMTILKSWPHLDTKQFQFLSVITWWMRTN